VLSITYEDVLGNCPRLMYMPGGVAFVELTTTRQPVSKFEGTSTWKYCHAPLPLLVK
jgi:hypothetical protein